MKKKGAIIVGVLVAVVIVVVLVAAIAYPYFYARSWGAKGKLTLTLVLDKTTMDLNGSINVQYKLTNTGTTDLRVVNPNYGSWVTVLYMNGTHVEWVGPSYAPPTRPTDDSLVTLKPGQSITHTSAISTHDWALEHNTTYKTVSSYYSGDEEKITLPYWKGTLTSNEIVFNVT